MTMKLLTCVSLFVCLLCCVSCSTYIFGNRTSSSRLVNREKVFFEAIPWKKRVHLYEYMGPDDLIINAIFCYDYQNSEASVNITSGGVGYNHVAIRMKSQRSYRLEYAIEIYD